MPNLFQKFRKFKNNQKIILIILIIISILTGFGFTSEITAVDYYIQSKLSTSANDVSAWGTVQTLDISTSTNKYGTIVPLLTGNMYATWIDNITIEGKKFTSGTTKWIADDFLYRKQVDILKKPGAGTDYQVKLLIGKTSGADAENFDLEGHCEDDFDDIRFTDNDEITQLDYWIESVTDSGTSKLATVWVEVADDLTGDTGTIPIYVYYGNASASSASNGDNTFLFFDDFDGDELDTDKWDKAASTTVTVANSEAHIACGGDDQGIGTKATARHPLNRSVEFREKFGETNITHQRNGFFDKYDSQNHGARFSAANTGDIYASSEDNDVSTTTNFGAYDTSYHRYQVARIDASPDEAKYYIDGIFQITHDTNVPPDDLKVAFISQNTADMYVEWVFVRKYVAAEPAYSSAGTEAMAWGTADTITSSGIIGMTKNMSAVSDSSGYVHLTYIDSSNYVKYQRYTGSWQTAVTLDSTATNEYTTIAIDTAGNNGIYAFWTRDNNIYYRRGCSPWTSTSTDWDSAVTFESAGGNSNDWAVAGYEDFGSGKIFAEWTQGSSSPYDIKWKSATSTACVTGINISGNIYLANESSSDTTAYTIALSVNNAEPTTTSTSSGSFQFNTVSVNANDPIAVYIQGHDNNDNTFTVTDGETNIDNLHLYLNKTAITNNNSGNTTNANICGFTNYPPAGDNLFTCSLDVPTFTGDEIHIMGGYAPGDDVNTSKMHIVTGGTYTGDTETLTLSGSGTGASRPLFNESGTFTTASSTTKFTGSALSEIQETTYYNLELKPSASATYRLASTGSQTITINNNLTVGNATATSTIDWTTNDPGITLKGNLDLNSPSIWTKSDTATLTWSPEGTKTWSDDNATKQDIGIVSISGGSSTRKIQLSTAVKATTLAVADAHELDLNSQNLNITNGALTTAGTTGTITCAACSAGKTTILGTGNLGGGTGAITFYDLDLGDNTETGTTTAVSDFTVSHVLTIDGGANYHVFDASSKTITLSGAGTPFVKYGTFTVGTSTIKYTGTSATNITAVTYNHLEFSPASGTPNYTIQNGTLTVNNNLTIGDGSNGVTIKADTNDPIMAIGNATAKETTTFLIKNAATFVGSSSNITVYGDLTLENGGNYTKGTGTLIFDGGNATYPRYFTDSNGTKENMGTVQIGASPAVTKLKSDMTADSLTVSAGDTLETQGWDPNIATFVTVNGTLNCTDSGGANNEGDGTTINLGTDWTVAVGATFTAQESETYPTAVIFDEAAASSVSPGGTDESHDFYNFLVTKSATSTVTLGAAIDVENDLTISNISSTLDVGSNYAINVAGSWSNSGAFTAGTGTVTFDSGNTGKTIVTGGTGAGKTFYDIVFDNSNGGWTISTNDLKATHNFNLTAINSAADSFTVASGITVTVQGEFKNDIGGVSTKWTGSTLVLDGSGSYCINTNKNVGDDTYATLQVSAGQYIRMWDSSAATSTISGSLYSMDHAANDGHLHIWGAYSVPSTTTDYWSYLKDFDGDGVSRQSQVTIESSASVTVGSSNESLEIKGNKTASNDKTTVTYAPASGSWDFDNSTGSELIFQEARIDYMKVNYGIVTALNTVLDGGWLTGYSYRKQVNIKKETGAGTNYQVKLKVGESSGASEENFDIENHDAAWPNDIRFTDNDGTTLLDHWLESTSGAVGNRLATFWVEIKDDLSGASGTHPIYVYYGKSGDSSASNGDNTFEFFDDFEDGTTNKWTDEANSNFVAVIDPVQYGTYAGHNYSSTAWSESYATFNAISGDRIIDVWLRKGETNLRSDFLIESTGGDYSNSIEIYFYSDGTLNYFDGTPHEIWASYNANTWYHFVFTLHSGADYTFDLDIDGVREVTGGGTRGTASSLTAISVMSGGDANSDLYVDNLFLRKYATAEPAYSGAMGEWSGPVAPAASATLNSDWYLGVHLVDAATTTTDINTGSTDVVISENSGTPQSTVWKYASSSWGSASTSQETGTGSNGEIPQPEIDDSIRIREYSRTSTGYTFYYYNLHVKWQASYGEYDYYERAGSNKYVISTYYSGGGHDNIINDSGTNDWHREDIDVNNAEPAIDDPPTKGTWYCGLRPGLEFEIVDSDSDIPPSLEIGALDSPNYTNTDWVDLKVNTSASNGYIITAWAVSSYTPDIFRHADYPSTTYIQDFIGTYATSTEWSGYCKDNSNYCGFGYTSSDPSVEGSNRYSSGNNYAKFVFSGPGNRVSDHNQPVSKADAEGTYRVTVKASVLATQMAGDYSTTLVFVCTAQY